MTKNLQISIIVLVVLIGIFLLNKNSQLKFDSTTEAIFTDNPEDIFKFLIQNGEEAIELSRVDTLWSISGNDTLEIKSRAMDMEVGNVQVALAGMKIRPNYIEHLKTFSGQKTIVAGKQDPILKSYNFWIVRNLEII